MGNYLFVPYSAHGHVNPMLPVIAQLAKSGERVRVLVSGRFADAVASVGASPIRLPMNFDVHVPDTSVVGMSARSVLSAGRLVMVGRTGSRLLRAEFAAVRPDLVITDPMVPWADRAARRAALLTALFSTTYATNEHVVAEWIRERFEVNRCGAALFRLHSMVRRQGRAGRLVLVNALPELQPARDTLAERFQFVGPVIREAEPEREDLPWPQIRSGPTLLVSPGTVFARRPEFFQAVVAAFACTEWTVVMATGRLDPRQLGRLPVNILARRHVPQVALLRHTNVFLTHGGMNSVLEALAAGVPMVVTPRAGDQFLVARLLVELGAGVRIAARLEPAEIRRAVGQLAGDLAMRRRLEQIRGRVRAQANAEAAAELLRQQVALRRGQAGAGT